MKSFGHTRPVRDQAGAIVGSKASPVRVRTQDTLGAAYGPDRNKRLIVECAPKDLIVLRPERTSRTVAITVVDLYAHCLRIEANRVNREKALAKRERKAERLARERQARAERRLFNK